MAWDGWLNDFDYLRAEFNKEKDLFGFSYAEIDGIEGFWIKPSERNCLPYWKTDALNELPQKLRENGYCTNSFFKNMTDLYQRVEDYYNGGMLIKSKGATV